MDEVTYSIRLKQWRNIVEQCEARPLNKSKKDWCSENGINIKRYYYWQRAVRCQAAEELQEAGLVAAPKPASEPVFAEIKLQRTSATFNASEISSGFQPDALIRVGSAMIGITNTISDRVLDRILKEVSHAC